MNKVVTSREAIIEKARELALEKGADGLNMRAVAGRCGIAVGSIYNYFPAKNDLMVAVVGEVWREIFHPGLCGAFESGFLALLEEFQEDIRQGSEKYPGFFAEHASMIRNKQQGRGAMKCYLDHMTDMLEKALREDPHIRPGVWDESFTPRDFALFVLDCLKEELLRGEPRQGFLSALVRRVLY